MAKETCCGCCHMITGAAVVGVLQAAALILLLSTAGTLLERQQIWKSDSELVSILEPPQAALDWTSTVNPSSTTPSVAANAARIFYRESGLIAFLELHLAHHIAFYCIWLLFLGLYALAFKFPRPTLVLPNIIMQVIAIIVFIILGGVIIAQLVEITNLENNHQMSASNRVDLDTRYAFYSVVLGVLVIALFLEIIFISIGINFYYYLRDTQNTIYPQMTLHHHSTTITQPVTAFNAETQPRRDSRHFIAEVETAPKMIP